jgi:REP element-mobilizing transposase RayT/transcriptional regulator with XRE-family HTH domain
MPRQARLDAPETLHHVMVRGIERTAVFRDDTDRADFLARLATFAAQGAWTVYAWAFLPNHAHLLVRTGAVPLAASMRRLLTGYVVNFNRRHKRVGHLFQNRYKSVVVEAEAYLLELVRYLHLNPLRAKVVADLRALDRYPWSGHSALLGTVPRPWQATRAILAQFGPTRARARTAYRRFVAAGIPQGRRPAFQGGGLVRSAGGWAAVRALRRHGTPSVADARILGSGTFVEGLLAEAAAREKATLRLARNAIGLAPLAQQVAARTGITAGELRSGLRPRAVVRARRLLCQAAVKQLGYTGAEVARYLGVTTSSVNRLALSPELPDLKKLMNAP